MQWLEKCFDASAARDVHAVVHFDLLGDDGGSLVLRIDGGRLDIQRGVASEPDVLMRSCARDFFGVVAGEENIDVMHMEGRLEVEGDLGVAMKLRTIFPAR